MLAARISNRRESANGPEAHPNDTGHLSQ